MRQPIGVGSKINVGETLNSYEEVSDPSLFLEGLQSAPNIGPPFTSRPHLGQ